MRGQDLLIAMRRKGVVPALVFVETDGLSLQRDTLWPIDPEHLHLHIAPGENVKRLDLRCLVDLTVAVSGCNAERVEAIAKACTEAKAARVIATTHNTPRPGRFEAVRVIDTEGALTWPAC